MTALGAFGVSVFGVLCATGLLAQRYRQATTPEDRSQVAIAAAGLSFPIFVNVVANFLLPGMPPPVTLAGAVGILVPPVAWLATVVGTQHPRAARNALLAMVAASVASILVVVTRFDQDNNIAAGLARLVSAAVLAYGVLRGHLLGLDERARWTLSKTTMASMFIAAFFVASEAAQQFFGETLGSSYWGIFAAGAPVFAFSPLQRLADRLAARAVPPGNARPDGAIGLYRRQVERAWADGRVGPKERSMLRALRNDLGLDATVAELVEEEVKSKAAQELSRRETGRPRPRVGRERDIT
jgi:hypothetical protein